MRSSLKGWRTPVSSNPAMTLGGLKQGVTPLDMAHAYETFATNGLRIYGSLGASKQGCRLGDSGGRQARNGHFRAGWGLMPQSGLAHQVLGQEEGDRPGSVPLERREGVVNQPGNRLRVAHRPTPSSYRPEDPFGPDRFRRFHDRGGSNQRSGY